MPKEYPTGKQPENFVNAEENWLDEGAKDKRKFYYEVRETKEFSIEDIIEQLAVIYGLRPEDFSSIDIKKESTGGMIENGELHLNEEKSRELFGHKVSFEFTTEGKITKQTQARITNLSRNDFYDDGDIRGEDLADYDRTTEKWIIKR